MYRWRTGSAVPVRVVTRWKLRPSRRVTEGPGQVSPQTPWPCFITGRGPRQPLHVPGKDLQLKTPPLGARLLAAPGVRARSARSPQPGRRFAAAFSMIFLRHGEIYPCDEGPVAQGHALPHRRMSLRVAIRRQVALLQSLPPLHRPARILQKNAFAVQCNSSERPRVS